MRLVEIICSRACDPHPPSSDQRRPAENSGEMRGKGKNNRNCAGGIPAGASKVPAGALYKCDSRSIFSAFSVRFRTFFPIVARGASLIYSETDAPEIYRRMLAL